MKKKLYETPLTQHVEVQLEKGVMLSASVFDPNDNEDRGVRTSQHEVNDQIQDFFDPNSENGWDIY